MITKRMNNNPEQDGADPSVDSLSPAVAERLANVMASHGVAARHQASLLGDLCGLSLSQARRKLRGSAWSFTEVLAVVRRFDASLDEVFAGLGPGIARLAAPPGPSLQEARFTLGGWSANCQVNLGALVPENAANVLLVAARDQEGWRVGLLADLLRDGVEGPYYHSSHITLTLPPLKPPARIAILDDEVGIAETLGEWFNEMGYWTTAYTSAKGLRATPLESFDAFIVDFILAGGESSQTLIEDIRRALPTAPILLLTGKLRDGQVSEADLATILRTSDVRLFEKPVRPAVLAAAIESCFDRVAVGNPP